MAYSTPRYVTASRSGRLTSIAAVIALHVFLLAVLSQLAPVRSALTSSPPVMVSLVTPPQEKPDALPKPLPPKPRAHRVPTVQPRPVITATPAATAAYTAPPPEPAPAPTIEVAPPPVAALPTPASAPAPAPAPVIPPRFNA